MKVVASPMPVLVAAAEHRVNMFLTVSTAMLAHEIKRHLAHAVLAGDEPTDEFVAAAEIEGLAVMEFANLVADKPNQVMARENTRRAVIMKCRAAASLAELDQALAEAGVPTAATGEMRTP